MKAEQDLWLQALKSGQIPEDFRSLDENVLSNNVEHEGEPHGTKEQGNTDSSPMEQVSIY